MVKMATEEPLAEPVDTNQQELLQPQVSLNTLTESLPKVTPEFDCQPHESKSEVDEQKIEADTDTITKQPDSSNSKNVQTTEPQARDEHLQVGPKINGETNTEEKQELTGEMKSEDGKQSEEETHEDVIQESCEADPNFSVVCSFFLKFGESLGISYSIEDLKVMLEDHRHIHEELVELHIKLLRKRRKYINKEKWEKTLIKFVGEYNTMDAWELERFGYLNVKTGIRLELLKRLLEAQFDFNVKFKAEINAIDASSLRLLPIGRDIKGHQYWYQLDADANIRIYQEMSDDEKSWQLICCDREGLIQFMEKLKTNTSLEPISNASCNVSESSEEEDDDDDAEHHDVEETAKISESFTEKKDMEIIVRVKEEVSEDTLNAREPLCEETAIKTESPDVKNGDVLEKLLPTTADEKEDTKSAEESVKTEDKLMETQENHVEKTTITTSVNIKTEKLDNQSKEEKETTVQDEDPIMEVLNSLLSNVEQLEKEDFRQQKQSNNSRGRSGSKGRRGRGRGRARPSSRVNTPTSATESFEVKQIPSAPKTSSRRSLSRELMELKGLAEQELLDFQEGAPRVRQSRRIAQIQEKKSAELAERMKQEQERMEAAAKRKIQMMEDRERKKKEYQDNLHAPNGKTKGRKVELLKITIRKGCLDTSSSDSSFEASENSSDEDFEDKSSKKKKGRRRRKGKGKKAYPWMDTSDSEEVHHEEEDEEIEEDDDEVLKFDDHDDEFACEEDEPASEPVVLRRARTAKKSKKTSPDSEEEDIEANEDEDASCKRCTKGDHPEWILLCDRCDAGFHTSCLVPPLMLIPDGDWFCPPCENVMLLERLETELEVLNSLLDKKERLQLKQKRLKYVTICEENIIHSNSNSNDHALETEVNGQDSADPRHVKRKTQKPSQRKRRIESDEESESEDDSESEDSEDLDSFHLRARRKQNVSYQFKEYDELIYSAIRASDEEEPLAYEDDDVEEEEEELEEDSGPQTCGKDMATIEHAIRKEEAAAAGLLPPEQNVSMTKTTDVIQNDGTVEPLPVSETTPVAKKRAPIKRRRLNDLDSPVEDDDSDESFKGSSGTEVDELSDFNGSNDPDATEEESDDSDFRECRRRSIRTRGSSSFSKRKKGKKSGGKRGYRRDEFVVDSDDDYGYGRGGRRTRGSSKSSKRKTYREISSDETEEEEEWISDDSEKPKKKRKTKDSDDTDEEWGSKKTKGSSKRKSRENDHEETEEETENESLDEDEDDTESEESEKEVRRKKVAEKAPPTETSTIPIKKKSPVKRKSPPPPKVKITPRNIEMRGKPRLSKARLMNLREEEDDEDDFEETSATLEAPTQEIVTNVLEEVVSVPAAIPSIEDVAEETKKIVKQRKRREPKFQKPPESQSVCDASVVTNVVKESMQAADYAPQNIRPSIESPLIAAALTAGKPEKMSPSYQPTIPVNPKSSHHLPKAQEGNPASALSALTAFASRGPAPQEMPPSMNPQYHHQSPNMNYGPPPVRPPPHNYNNFPPGFQHRPPPPHMMPPQPHLTGHHMPSQTSFVTHPPPEVAVKEKTKIESKTKGKRAKNTPVAESIPSAIGQDLQPEVTNKSKNKRGRKSSEEIKQPTEVKSQVPPNAPYPPPNQPQNPYGPPPPQQGMYPPPGSYYPPSHGPPGYPGHPMYRQPPPQGPHHQYPHHPGSQPPPSYGFRPNGPPDMQPGYPYQGHPGFPNHGPPPGGPHQQQPGQNYPPMGYPPPGMHPSHYNQFYAGSPNGGFMIQNLLHAQGGQGPPPPQNQTPPSNAGSAVSSHPTPNQPFRT